MKNMILMAMCLVCCFISASLAEDTVTLAELKQQTPERLVLDVTDQDGNTVHIDMPVVLPDGETLPVLRVKPVLFDTSDFASKYPQGKGLSHDDISDQLYKDTTLLLAYIRPQDGGKPRATPQTSTESGRYVVPEGQPAHNEMPASRPIEIVRENVQRFTGRDDFDIRVFRQQAMSGLYRYQNVAQWDSPLNLNKPRKGYEKGTWQLAPAQYLYGAEIFQGQYRPSAQHDFLDIETFWPEPMGGWLFVLDEDDYGMGLRLLEEVQVVQDDAPLAPFDVIRASIEQRIQSGQLKSGYQLTLGYNVCCRPGEPNVLYDDPDAADIRFTLVPAWRIDGYDTKDAAQFEDREVTQEAILAIHDYSYSLRLDARTGEVLLDYRTQL